MKKANRKRLQKEIAKHAFLWINDEACDAGGFAVHDTRNGGNLGTSIDSLESLEYLVKHGAEAWLESRVNGGRAVQAQLRDAIRENLSPEGVAALVMALQPAGSIRTTTPEGKHAIQQVIWLRDMLLDLIGVEAFNRQMDELGF